MEKLKEKLDFKKLNEAIGTGNKILKLLYNISSSPPLNIEDICILCGYIHGSHYYLWSLLI